MVSLLFGTILGEDENNKHIYRLYINQAIEIIALTIITYFFLKYKYYLHHIISIVAIVIFAVIIDIILDNYPHTSCFISRMNNSFIPDYCFILYSFISSKFK